MSKPDKGDGGAKKPTYRIPPNAPWASAWKIAAVLAVIGLVTSTFGMLNDPKRFAFSWLFAFMTFLAFGLGGLFYVIMQHITGAGWGVGTRRTAEFLLSGLPVFALLFIPLAFHMDELYPWTHTAAEQHDEAAGEPHGTEEADEHGALTFGGSTARAQEAREPHDLHPNEVPELSPDAHAEHADAAAEHADAEHATGEHHGPEHAVHEAILESKVPYLNRPFFLARAAFYLLIWIVLAYAFFSMSTRQDKERGLALTKKMQGLAPVATIIFGLSLTFAAFDWMMSLEPSWFSTIFGVQYFAVSAVVGNAALILIALGLSRAGYLGQAVGLEHLHDVGKLLFGFLVFWAYISFSQFMLIWYAGIPEEATYYHLRWWGGGGYLNISLLLIIGHFVIPFFLLISRNAKRRLSILAFASAWILVMHVVEVYWLVMPYAESTGLVTTSLRVHWMDLAALFAVGGVYMAVVLWQMTRYPLVPVGDPRLSRAIAHEVV